MTRFLIFFLLLVGVVSGQPRDMFPWWETPLARDLNLSDEQMKQIQSIVKENRDRLVDLRASVEKADHGVNDLMNDERPDVAKFTAALDRQAAARGELTKVFSLMGFKIRMVLTPQQWHELQKRREPRGLDSNRGGKKGPGGQDRHRPQPQRPPGDRQPQDRGAGGPPQDGRPLDEDGSQLPVRDPADGGNI